MKGRSRRLCLLIAAALAAGVLGGCGAGGGAPAIETTAAGEGVPTTQAVEAGTAPQEYETEAALAAGEINMAQGARVMNRTPDMAIENPGVIHNTEEYSYNPENPFTAVANSPLSTFGADVDTASYANIRRMILAGNQVPEDAVRIEEMLNYFYYDYPEPEGDEPFSVTTRISQCPWNESHDLLQIGLQAEKMKEDRLPKSNLVFLLDVSGSMEAPDKLDLVKRAFLMLTENLKPEDSVSIVTYASSDQVVLDGAVGEDKTEIMTAIENLTAGGSTAGSKGIVTAYELAEKHFIEGGNNRVILATDGDLNVGVTSEGELTRLIEDKRESGVYLSVLGFGTGNIKDNKMETLADHGNGHYAYVDSAMEARKVLAEELGGTLFTVAKDVKFQVEFNPSRVKGYRLIGYENRVMADRDFEDDTKDGGEIGAGHRVTVLYELIPADSDEEVGEVDLKYQPSVETQESGENSFDGEWLNVKIRYKEPDEEESRLLEYPVKDEHFQVEMPEDMAFAASVAEAGMLLKKSEYKGNASYENVIRRLESMKRVKEDDYSQEFLYLVKRMEKLN